MEIKIGLLIIYFIVFFGSNLWEIFLLVLNLKHSMVSDIPEIFRKEIDTRDCAKSKSYLKEKTVFAITEITVKTFITFLCIIYFFPLFESVGIKISFKLFSTNYIFQSIIFFFLVGVLYFIIEIPFDVYSSFVLEKRYGFSKITTKIFAVDKIKTIVISIIFGATILFLFFEIFFHVRMWWMFLSILIILLILFIEWIYPIIIFPIFYKLKPLENEKLRAKIEEIANKVRFKITNVYVMDASKRSTHTNAFFTGLGKSKRIVFYDTLLKEHTDEEVLAIFAHEAGHYYYKHVLKSILLSCMVIVFLTFFFFLLTSKPIFIIAFNIPELYIDLPYVYALIFLNSIFTFLEFIPNSISRKFEFQADKFATLLTSKNTMVEMLKRLMKVNLSNLNPHNLYSLFKYTHPAPVERIEAIIKENKDSMNIC